MKNFLGIVALCLLLVSCDQINNTEDYMLNCVKENLSRNNKDITTEDEALRHCLDIYSSNPEVFNYYRGFVWSKPSRL